MNQSKRSFPTNKHLTNQNHPWSAFGNSLFHSFSVPKIQSIRPGVKQQQQQQHSNILGTERARVVCYKESTWHFLFRSNTLLSTLPASIHFLCFYYNNNKMCCSIVFFSLTIVEVLVLLCYCNDLTTVDCTVELLLE